MSYAMTILYVYYLVGEPVPNGTGKYTDIHRFDARVFAVNPVLAECTDVINRKVLEPSFEAVLDAGKRKTLKVSSTSLSKINTCVFFFCQESIQQLCWVLM